MAEVWTPPFTAVTNAVVSSSDHNAGVRGNLLWIRQFLSGNPTAAGQQIVATGVDSAAWTTMPVYVNSATQLAGTFAPALVGQNKSGFYVVGAPGDAPQAGRSYYCINIGDYAAPATHCCQIAIDNLDPTRIYIREVIAGTATAWTPILTSVGATVPSGLIGGFANAGSIASGWTRFTSLDGRIPVGAGTTFSQTFVEGASAGSSWAHLHDGSTLTTNTVAATIAGAAGTSSTPAHSHTISGNTANATWIPPVFGIVFAQKT